MLAIRVLGGVRLGEATADRLSTRQRLVLAILAARHGRGVADDTLIEAIWGEQPPKSARTALQTYVSELRDLLEPDRPRRSAGRFIHTDGATYQLVCGRDDLDLAAVEADLDTVFASVDSVRLDAVESSAGVQRADLTSLLDGVLAVWGRPFGELADHERLFGVAARLEERFAAAVEARTAFALGEGSGPEMIDTVTDAVRAAPFRERLAGQLALCRYRSGDRIGALDELRALSARLRGELGLDPGPEIVELERAVLDHDVERLAPSRPDDEAAPLMAARRRWSLAPMLGREGALDDAVAQLDRWPLIALTGPGGVGKTTIARAVLDRQPDDVALALVDLSELSEPTVETLVRAIANALGVNEQPGASLAEAIIDATSADAAMLVLDTAEVAPTVVDDVLTRLVRASKLRVIVTSQLSIAAPSAVELSVAPLDTESALQILGPSGATQPAGDDELLEELADRLGRLPLALEIAAARVRTHGARDTLQRLRDGEDFEAVSSSRPDRHRSSRAAAGWGISFLDAASHQLLARLAVHVAPADLAVITEVWTSGELDAASIERAVDDLCRRSLLTRVGLDDRVTYRVPDPVRLAMVDQTTDAERATFTQRIAQVVLETAQATMFGATNDLTLLQLEGEVPRAHDTLHHAGDMNELTLAGCCSLFWASRGRSVEGLSYMERALATHRTAPELLYRPVAGITTFVAYASGDMRRTRELLDLFTAGADESASTPVDMITLTVEASRAFIDLDYEQAIDYFDRALVFYPNPTGPKLLLLWLAGNSRWYAGRHDDARATYRTLRENAIAVGEPHNESLALRFEAMVDAQTGDIERAWRLAERSMTLARRLGDPGSLCQAEVALAVVAHASDSLDEAEQHALEAIRLTLRPFDLFTQRTGPPIIAASSVDRGEPERAAVALGWHDHYLESTEQPATIAARRIVDDAKRRTKSLLGDAGYARHAGRGAGMRLAELHRFLIA